jgi:hypothetical protein
MRRASGYAPRTFTCIQERPVTQAERFARQEVLRDIIKRLEGALTEFRAEVEKTLAGCEHTYPDGRTASTGGSTKICSVCGAVLKGRDDKLWG